MEDGMEDGMDEGEEVRKSDSWIMIISEQHRYQGVSYKSDITVISGTNISHDGVILNIQFELKL